MWAGIAGFFAALPRLIDLFERAVKAYEDFVETQKDKALLEKFKNASSIAIKTKDTSELEAIFRGEK